MLDTNGLIILSTFYSYYLPFLAITTATLVLYSNLDRKVALILRTTPYVGQELLFLNSFLSEIRKSKTAIIRVASIFFYLLTFIGVVTIAMDLLNLYDQCLAAFSIIAAFLNWLFLFIALVQLIGAYDYLHVYVHDTLEN